MSLRKSILNPILKNFGYHLERIRKDQEAIIIPDNFTKRAVSPFLSKSKIARMLEARYQADKSRMLGVLTDAVKLKEHYFAIPSDASGDPLSPCWNNPGVGLLDAVSLYFMVTANNPRHYIECGSGYSTKFVARAIADHGLRTKIISIDPAPRVEIDSLCHQLYRVPLESLDRSVFHEFSKEDIFVFDGSHRSFPNSDVTVFMTEILPEFPKGILYAIHDIFLPNDYPEEWAVDQKRYYNEQYLLAAYLLGGAMGDSVELPLAFLSGKPEVRAIFEPVCGSEAKVRLEYSGGGFFWMRKG